MSQDPSFPAPPPPPPPPSGGGDAALPKLPWDDRDRLGILNALIETVKLIVTAPRDAFSRLRPDGDLIWPLLFGLILSWIGQVFGQLWNLIFGGAMQSMMGGLSEFEDLAVFGATSMVQVAFTLILWPIFYGIVVFIMAGIYHLCLMLLGGVENSPLGFEGTLKVVAYSQVVNLANVIPIFGFLIALVGSIVLNVIGLSEVHKTDQGKALIAVLIPLVLCCVCVIIGAFVFGAGIAAMAGAAG